jgi:hypothetical protein
VKIVLDPGSKFAGELRPGMSVYPTIETKPRDLRTASASVRDQSERLIGMGRYAQVRRG